MLFCHMLISALVVADILISSSWMLHMLPCLHHSFGGKTGERSFCMLGSLKIDNPLLSSLRVYCHTVQISAD
jgi:hypothetical protein